MRKQGGTAVASAVWSDAPPAKSPWLKKSLYSASTASISAFWANAGAISAATRAITGAILRMTRGSRFDVNICAFPDFPQDRREDSFLRVYARLAPTQLVRAGSTRAQRFPAAAKSVKRAGD